MYDRNTTSIKDVQSILRQFCAKSNDYVRFVPVDSVILDLARQTLEAIDTQIKREETERELKLLAKLKEKYENSGG